MTITRVPELIIKGWAGLILANFEEMFIGTVNMTENVGIASQISSSSVIHGHGHKEPVGKYMRSQWAAFFIFGSLIEC